MSANPDSGFFRQAQTAFPTARNCAKSFAFVVSRSANSYHKNERARPARTSAPEAAPSSRGDRSKRLLDLVMLLLRARSPVTFRTIREQFAAYKTANVDAGLRAFERDKADLLELGVPVRYLAPDEDDALEEGGYVVDLKRYRLPEVRLTAEEIAALVLAVSVARAVPGGSTPKIVDLTLRKLAFDMYDLPDTPDEFPLSARAVTSREPVLVHFPKEKSTQSRAMSDRFSQLESATRGRKRVTLRYQSASTGTVQIRDVDPYGLAYRQGAWILVGYCHLRAEIRSFRLDRIGEVKIAPKPKSPDFERPPGFDVRTYVNRSPWTFQIEEGETVELEIYPQAADIANEDFGVAAAREAGPEGTLRVTFSCGNPDFAMSRILASKGGIVVRKGSRLKTRVAAELDQLNQEYVL